MIAEFPAERDIKTKVINGTPECLGITESAEPGDSAYVHFLNGPRRSPFEVHPLFRHNAGPEDGGRGIIAVDEALDAGDALMKVAAGYKYNRSAREALQRLATVPQRKQSAAQ